MKKILLVLATGLMLIGCNNVDNGVNIDHEKCWPCGSMPTGATDVEVIDLHWAKFTLGGERFLMFIGNNRAAITKISE